MASGFGLNTPPQAVTSPLQELLARQLKLQATLKNGAGWFIWVAGLSMLNSVLAVSGSSFQFIFGLGIAQVFDELAKRSGAAGAVLGLIINAIVAAGFVLCWHFARKGNKPPFLAGIILYALDALLILTVGAWLALAFHAFALFGMIAGVGAITKLQALEGEIAALRPPETVSARQMPLV